MPPAPWPPLPPRGARFPPATGKLINTSGGMSPACASFTRHFWRSFSALSGVAFLAEAALRSFAAFAEHRINIAAEQRGDVDLHLLALEVGVAHHVAVDGAGFVFGEHDGGFGADARAGGAVGFAVVVVLHLNFLPAVHAIDAEQAEAQALHAVRAAVVVDDREPRLPIAVLRRVRPGATDSTVSAMRFESKPVTS